MSLKKKKSYTRARDAKAIIRFFVLLCLAFFVGFFFCQASRHSLMTLKTYLIAIISKDNRKHLSVHSDNRTSISLAWVAYPSCRLFCPIWTRGLRVVKVCFLKDKSRCCYQEKGGMNARGKTNILYIWRRQKKTLHLQSLILIYVKLSQLIKVIYSFPI